MNEPRGGYQQLLAWPSFRVDLPNTPQQVGPWAVCVVLMYVCVVQLYDSVHTRTPVCPPSAEAAQRVLSGLHGSRHALLPPTLQARRWVAAWVWRPPIASCTYYYINIV